MTLPQIRAKLEKKFALLSFTNEDLVSRLNLYPEVKIDSIPNGYKLSVTNDQLI